ncbi:ABC transporter permease [Lichenihabitans sp. Uapishka_5]|uniref:ABC transporter permease n=1 Tax=Lichenihabitans sp. Uapishka_5 TaxID=3037302 RepID=UPI0029E8162B|nr:ABC transporter permease [Lichenihabitans sp. Uapishka_5]MDX7950303.1 ABC transporter permease [Lichenihabitans sp. Uapishka_5]
MALSADGSRLRARNDNTSPRQARASATAQSFSLRDWMGPASWLLTIAVIVIVFSLLNPRFASVENLRNVLVQASVPLIIVVGTTLVILMGSIDLSVQGVMGAAGMAWILLVPNARGGTDLGAWAWPVALGVGLGLGLATGLIYTRFRVPSFVVTLGTWNVGLGIATMLYGDDLLPSLTSEALSQWPTRLTLGLPNGFWLSAAVVAAGVLLIGFTHLGRGILAIGNNEPMAVVNGIPVARIKVAAFGLAGLLYGLAGVLATMELGSGSPGVGAGQLFTVIPAAVIGGTALSGGQGGVLHSALGVLLLIVLNNGLVLAGVSPDYQSGVFGATLLLAIVVVAWPHRDRLRIAK